MGAVESKPRTAKPYADVPAFPPAVPIDLVALAGRRQEIELEVGFGRGRFALERATARPEVFLLAVETRRKYVHTAAETAAGRGLGNVLFRHGDARELVSRFVPDGCVACAFVNFPDPWWKARHAKRTVVATPLIGEIARLLRPGGELFVQTDVPERAEAFRGALDAEPRLVSASPGGFVAENPYGATSNRERHCVEVEVPIFRLRYLRRGEGG
jgi:tRNA (guanine-N7-)-methyltransferase